MFIIRKQIGCLEGIRDSVLYLLLHKQTFWCLLQESKLVAWKVWGTLFCITSATKKPFDVYYKKANRLAGRHEGLCFVSPPPQWNLLMFIARKQIGWLEGIRNSVLCHLLHKETVWCLLQESKSGAWKEWGILFCISSSTKKPFDVYYKKANRMPGRYEGLCFVSHPPQRNLLMFITRKQIGCLEGMRDPVLYLLLHKEMLWCLLHEFANNACAAFCFLPIHVLSCFGKKWVFRSIIFTKKTGHVNLRTEIPKV